MKLLVTGSNGFLGAAVTEALVREGDFELECLVREGSRLDRLESLRGRHARSTFTVKTGSLASVSACREALGDADCVVHLAAALSGEPADMYANTVVTTRNLLEAMTSSEKARRLVHVSSFGVYGAAELPRRACLDEATPLERRPLSRDPYSYVKLRQEELVWRYQREHGFPLVILRPGVIYGPGGGALSSRVGLQLPGVFLFLGGDNLMPLSYVDNCADAIVRATQLDDDEPIVLNVHDDDLPTCREYLAEYERRVGRLRKMAVPYPVLGLGSRLVLWYHEHSRGQLPAVFTPYKVAATWKGHRFSNAALKRIGWRQRVPTREGMERTFTAARSS